MSYVGCCKNKSDRNRGMIMKVGLIYTSTTPELIADVEREVKKQLGDDVEMVSLQDPSILADVRAAGYVTAAPAARLIGMYMKAVEEGADAMLNLCSSVGEVADCVQDAARYLGVPIVRVDEEMCREAVRLGKRVGGLRRHRSVAAVAVAVSDEVVVARLDGIAEHKSERAMRRRHHVHLYIHLPRLALDKRRAIAIDGAIPHGVVGLVGVEAKQVVGLGDGKLKPGVVESIVPEPAVETRLMPVAVVDSHVVELNEVWHNMHRIAGASVGHAGVCELEPQRVGTHIALQVDGAEVSRQNSMTAHLA